MAAPMLTRPATNVASRLALLAGGPQHQVAGDRGDDQRRDEVGAAARVLLVGHRRVEAALVGRHALVLGAVITRQARVAQQQEDGGQRDAGRGQLLEERRAAPRAAQGERRDGARRRGREQPRVFLREHGAAGGAAHGGQHGEGLAEPQQTPQQRDALQAFASREARLLAGRHLDAAAGTAHGGSPESLALQQDAVPQSHAAELHCAYPFVSSEAVAEAASRHLAAYLPLA